MALRRDSARTDTGRGPRRGRAGAGSSPGNRQGARRRPAPTRRAVTVDSATAQPTARSGLTMRAAILAVALASVALALALPLKVYLAQRSDINQLEQQTHEQKARVSALEEQQRQWADPAFVKAQARERLHFVLPGETAYIVLGSPPPGGLPTVGAGSMQAPVNASQPWYSQLWHSVEVAGRASAATPTHQ